MRKYFLLITLIILGISSRALAQCGEFTWLSPNTTSNLIYDTWFATPDTVIAVGERGTVLRSIDGGESWSFITGVPTYNLRSVYFTSTDTGYVVGEIGNAGAVLKTTDRGASWDVIWSDNAYGSTYGIYFTSSQVGFTIGPLGRVRKTIDAGINWTYTNVPVSSSLFAITFISADTGFVGSSNGHILRTVDGGDNWSIQSTITTQSIYSISFSSPTEGIAVGNSSTVLKTTDAGATWTSVPVNGIFGSNMRDVEFISSDTAYAVATDFDGYGQQHLYRSVNGGSNWSIVGVNAFDLLAISFEGNNAVAVGYYGQVFQSLDRGLNWIDRREGTMSYFQGLSFPSSTVGYAAGSQGVIMKTSDAGNTWQVQSSGTTQGLNDIHFPTTLIGYAVGQGGVLRKTTNGGNTWQDASNGSGSALNSVYFISADTGFVVGQNGIIRRTTNGGSNWNAITSPVTQPFTKVWFLNSLTGFIVGQSGAILRTDNGGLNWVSQNSNTTNSLTGINFINSEKGFAVGLDGLLLRTTNGGVNWTSGFAGWGDNIYDIQFTDSLNGYLCTGEFNGSIYRTTNGGLNWTAIAVPVNGYLTDLEVLHADTVAAVGFVGAVVKAWAVSGIPIVQDVSRCGLGAVTITPTGGGNFYWYDSPDQFIPIGIGNSFTTPQLVQTDTFWVAEFNGFCAGRRTPVVTFINSPGVPPTITPSGPVGLCLGDSVMLQTQAVAGYSYQWLVNGSPIVNALSSNYLATQSGDYSVIVANTSQCTDTAASINVVVNSLPLVTFDIIDSVALNANPFPLTGGLPLGGIYTGPGVNANIFDPSDAGVGTHILMYSYTDTNGCSSTAHTSINVTSVLNVDVSKSTDKIYVYPNPFIRELQLQVHGREDVGVSIFSSIGSEVYSTSYVSSSQMQTLVLPIELAEGVYILQVNSKGRSTYIKIFKQ